MSDHPEAGGEVTLDIDLGWVDLQIAALRAQLGPQVRIFASVKADGYGFGASAVAQRAEAAGADGIALADRAQAVAIRQAGFRGLILVYAGAPIDADAARVAAAHDLILTVLSQAEAEALAAGAGRPVSVAIKVEVGTERLGVLPAELGPLVRLVDARPGLRLVMVNAHPSLGDDAPMAVLDEQFKRFRSATAEVLAGRDEILTLFASSKVLRRTAAMSLNAVDPGQMLYEPPLDRPMIRRMWTRLLMARDVTRDFAPEYAPFPLAGIRRVGVVPYGRVDGAGRCDAGQCGVAGRVVAFLGPPSLEYWRVDLTALPDAKAGDLVEIIGAPGQAGIDLPSVLARQGIQRETDFALTIPPRVRRRHIG